jgi:hypothetical protein
MTVTDEGMQIDVTDEQYEKAPAPRVESREPVSNVTIERWSHQEKQESPIVLTDEGMQIEVKHEQE